MKTAWNQHFSRNVQPAGQHARRYVSGSNSRGLTFLELLMTLAMSTLMIMALAHIIYSLTRALAVTEEGPQQAIHMDGLTEFLGYCFAQSTFNTPGQNRSLWHMAPRASTQSLAFRLEDPPPFFVTGILPTPAATAFLQFDEEQGLHLLWHVDPAQTNDRPQIRLAPLSSNVMDLEYGYWNPDNSEMEWESAADDGAVRVSEEPRFIRLVFDWDGLIKKRTIDLQPRLTDRLIY